MLLTKKYREGSTGYCFLKKCSIMLLTKKYIIRLEDQAAAF